MVKQAAEAAAAYKQDLAKARIWERQLQQLLPQMGERTIAGTIEYI